MNWKRIIFVVGVAIAGFGFYIWYEEFYYHEPQYSFGVKNECDEILRNTLAELKPSGTYEVGILDPSQGDFYENPTWPIPTNIVVTFQDSLGSNHAITVVPQISDKFRGELIVKIQKTNGVFAAVVVENLRK